MDSRALRFPARTRYQLSPEFLGRVGRELIWPGESVFLIDVDGGGAVRLFPVSAYEIRGGYDPSTWIYEVELVGPSRAARLVRPASAILHFRFSADARRPGRGIGPLGHARISARLLGEIETALADEVSGTRWAITPDPIGWRKHHAYEVAIHCRGSAR